MEISGVAWIDPSGNIHRIEMNVGSSMSDMGLKSVRAQLNYGLVTLKDEPEPQWLPVSATIDLETPKQHWRNIHRFVNYKKYRTEIKLDTMCSHHDDNERRQYERSLLLCRTATPRITCGWLLPGRSLSPSCSPSPPMATTTTS